MIRKIVILRCRNRMRQTGQAKFGQSWKKALLALPAEHLMDQLCSTRHALA